MTSDLFCKIFESRIKEDNRVHNTIKATSCQETVPCARMRYMEIALLPKNSLKIKGKHASFIVDRGQIIKTDAIVIDGPGEYEIGGIKISGSRSDGEVVYNLNVDGVDVLLGKLSTLEKQQHKLKEQNIVVVDVDSLTNASFVTSLASSVVIFYGEQAPTLIEKFGKENIKNVQKYTAVSGKLPAEVETVILQ